jgi:hypothetical protein
MQPTWTVLAVAVLGVAGTLSAAVFTQIWGARREDLRWRQERLAEDQRWQRQQQERRDLWQREDELGAVQRRQEAYTAFLLAVATWASAAYTVLLDPSRPGRAPGEDDLARLGLLVERAEASCVPLRLHGAIGVADAADKVCAAMLAVVRALSDAADNRDRIDRALQDFRRTSDRALALARADLGVT